MCEKAVEIQEKWKVEEGDFCTERDFQCRTPVGCIDDGQAVWSNNQDELADWHRDCIWLPRQDQLQEMWKPEGIFMQKCGTLIFWLEQQDLLMHKWSGEQLWLAFVMKELYSKQWNGEDWT